MQEARRGGGDDFVSKTKRQGSEELLLLSEASGRFCVSVPGVIFPGPSVNKAIRYSSLSLSPQTRCWSLPPPRAPLLLLFLQGALVCHWGYPDAHPHVGATSKHLRVTKAPAGAGAEPGQPHCSFCKTEECSGEFRDTDALPGRDMEESWALFILTRE